MECGSSFFFSKGADDEEQTSCQLKCSFILYDLGGFVVSGQFKEQNRESLHFTPAVSSHMAF